jgi:hypothetical protein
MLPKVVTIVTINRSEIGPPQHENQSESVWETEKNRQKNRIKTVYRAETQINVCIKHQARGALCPEQHVCHTLMRCLSGNDKEKHVE